MNTRIVWFIIGCILTIVGRLRKRQSFYNLGHYLTGSGRDVRLFDIYTECVVDYIKSGRFMESVDNYMIINAVDLDTDLFHAVGKFKVIKTERGSEVEDWYMFYPVCAYSYFHFEDCGCQDRKWGSLSKPVIATRLPGGISKFLHKKFNRYDILDKKIYLKRYENDDEDAYIHLGMTHYWIGISVHIPDNYWVDKGKPFYTRAVLPI